jgi:cyclohexanecarboxylate-CoA ligase
MTTVEAHDFRRVPPWSDLAYPSPERAARFYAAGWWRKRTFLDDLADAVRDRPDHTAIIAYENGQLAKTLTFAEVDVLVTRFAAALTELGARHGTVVVPNLPNRWQFTVLYLACNRIGAVVSGVNPILGERELGHVLTYSQASICVTVASHGGVDFAARLAEVAPASLKHQVIIGETSQAGTIDFDAFFVDTRWEDRHSLAGVPPAGSDDPSLLMYTSGTTGTMKATVHSQNTLYCGIRAEIDSLGLRPQDVLCVPHYMTQMAGMYPTYMGPMLGCTSVMADPNTDMGQLLDLITAHRVSYVYCAPSYVRNLLDEQRRAPRDTASLRNFVSGSAPIGPELVTATQDVLGIELRALWGMTETGCTTITREDDPPGWAAHSDGSPVPWMEVRIAADEDSAAGQQDAGIGRMLVRGASLCLGYLGQPETYAECVDSDGWFDTGDLARDDGRGGVKLMGRRSDLISRADGHKVSTLEVESVLVAHPAVGEVILLGYPDPDVPGAELVGAIVVPQGPPPALEDLRTYLEQARMARTTWPDWLMCVQELPRNSLGKIQRAELREQLESDALRPR